jgi:hypothetical protein
MYKKQSKKYALTRMRVPRPLLRDLVDEQPVVHMRLPFLPGPANDSYLRSLSKQPRPARHSGDTPTELLDDLLLPHHEFAVLKSNRNRIETILSLLNHYIKGLEFYKDTDFPQHPATLLQDMINATKPVVQLLAQATSILARRIAVVYQDLKDEPEQNFFPNSQ